MSINSNHNTYKLCKDLCNIFNISTRITNNFTSIIAKALVHRVAEEALDKESGKLKDLSIGIPYVCTINIQIIDNSIEVDSIEFDDKFKEQVIRAINTGESPLVADAEKALVESLKNRYNSLI